MKEKLKIILKCIGYVLLILLIVYVIWTWKKVF